MQPNIDEEATAKISSAIGQWDQGVMCLAALALAVDTATAEPLLVAAAREVVAAAGLGHSLGGPERLPFSPPQLRGMAASPLLQAAALVGGLHKGWAAHSDAALIAQGRASGSAATLFARFVLPRFGNFGDRMARPGARMLDVGTGIGALAVGFAQIFPQLQVTGIDVMARVVDLARSHVDTSQVASRVELRQQDVAELADQACYDLAWIPAPFVPEPAFSTGVARIIAALRPGGLLMVGHGRFDGTDLENALTRFKTVAYGGTVLDGPSAVRLLNQQGLASVQTIPTPPGAPAVTVGRR